MGSQWVTMRALVVEDEIRLADALKRGLGAEGFVVDVAHTGTDGLWMATEFQYDVIVLDIMLQGMNGYEVCASLRKRQNWTPILMLTAKHGKMDEAEALDTGADDFLSKPFSYMVLVARLRALIRRGAPQRPVVMALGPIALDPTTRTCTVDGEDAGLTVREFAIFEYLMRRAEEVVSKTDIIANVWDDEFEGGDNIVEVHISALRRKLGAKVIETVRGLGYRLNQAT
jgi:DNA-binding response OmpR family regulator